MALKTVEIPSVGGGRPAEINPYLDDVRDLAINTTALVIEDLADEKAAKVAVGQVQRAGREFGKTVRVKTAEVTDGKTKGTFTVTFWTVPKITQVRKPKAETVETPAAS